MSRLLALFLLGACVSSPAFTQSQKSASSGPDIIVTGTSLKEAKESLAACLMQHCPPDKDIDATLRVAETQFVAGDYEGARATMQKSLGRNRRYAKTYPVPVSDLLRANSRIAAHLGETEDYRIGATSVLRTLRAGLPKNDPRILGAQIEAADSFAGTGQIDTAVSMYREVVRQAHATNQPKTEGFARLRIALLYSAISQRQGVAYAEPANRAINDLINERNPEMRPFVQAAKLLQLTMAVKRGVPGAMDKLVMQYREAGAGTTTPLLLYAPTIELRPLSGVEEAGGDPRNQVSTYSFEDQWIDVGFVVGADGKVTEVEVLRQSSKTTGDWSKPVLNSISGRRYAPLAKQTPDVLRVERYTLTSRWVSQTGSRLRTRSPIPHIEVLDLSRDPDPKTIS
ncbi:tetratricopeptide repeat protein [Sphingomonas sp. MMS24-J45]|uniref:tetratricopeptide repeat protein n=1 Tax=Sphingomonas sp. MMS24-J45 TaxID=3238806 RepID=UPI00384FB346